MRGFIAALVAVLSAADSVTEINLYHSHHDHGHDHGHDYYHHDDHDVAYEDHSDHEFGSASYYYLGEGLADDNTCSADACRANAQRLAEQEHKIKAQAEEIEQLKRAVATLGYGHTHPGAYCDPSPCLNGGLCSDTGTDFSCACVGGFTGKRCETAPVVNPCSPDPCLNGGACRANGADFECACVNGFAGDRCETPASNPGDCLQIGGRCGSDQCKDVTLEAVCPAGVATFLHDKCYCKAACPPGMTHRGDGSVCSTCDGRKSCDLGHCDNMPNPGYVPCPTATTCQAPAFPPNMVQCSGELLSTTPALTDNQCAQLCGDAVATCAQFEDYCAIGDQRCVDNHGMCLCYTKQTTVSQPAPAPRRTVAMKCADCEATTCLAFSQADATQCTGNEILHSSPDPAKCKNTDVCGVKTQEECSALCASRCATCSFFSDYCDNMDGPGVQPMQAGVAANCKDGLSTCTCWDGPRENGCTGCTENISYASHCFRP